MRNISLYADLNQFLTSNTISRSRAFFVAGGSCHYKYIY